ncbi:hypothetical protein ANANG_G00053170 [Anguilla anguilla]|uniref:Ig-like domain-containing protein n=1 Tax=Anguilla anguilla TaxID=7936 RepID=A0A9D3S1U6_ANGAN|nr:hypothetical protein ANANG_G00053170 [Anguilla anguilla]
MKRTEPLLLISALLLLLQSQFCFPVTVSSPKPKVEIHENEDAVLPCVFKTEKDSHPRIEWKKKGKDISYVYFNGTFRGSFAGRAKMEGATVTLYRATLRDSGEYRCEVSASMDSNTLGEAEVSLKVLGTVCLAPHTPLCEIPSSALTGAVVEMRCEDRLSFPPATYRWYKDNRPLSSTRQANLTYTLDTQSGKLYFRAVSQADSGQYRCEASNGVGAPKSCEGKHLQIDMYDMNMMIIITVAAGGLLLLSVSVLGVCCCCWRRRCKHQKGKGSSDTPHQCSSSSLPNPQYYRHTQSFVL